MFAGVYRANTREEFLVLVPQIKTTNLILELHIEEKNKAKVEGFEM